MSEWITKPLGEITSYIAKGIPPKYVDRKTDDSIYVLNQKCNRNFVISYDDARFHDLTKKVIANEKMLKTGDVLINSTGTGTAGRVAQIHELKGDTTFDGHMILLRPTSEVESLYFGYAVKSHQQEIENFAEGSTGQTEINRVRLLNEVLISFPKDKSDQQAISHLLKNIDDKIELNIRINNNLLQQAQAIYKSWFVDFDPFSGLQPKDWVQGVIDDLAADIVCGKTPSTKKSEYYGDFMPFITIPDMHNNVYVTTTTRYLSEEGVQSQIKKILPANSICVSCIGTAGLVSLVAKPSQTNQQINSIIPKQNFSAYYIFLLMQTLSEKINRLGQSGSTIVNLNKAQFGRIEVTVPSIEAMKNFDNVVSPIFTLILTNMRENERLSTLRDTLLPKLMSGEIDVSDIDL